jgi:hypothetical protein
METARHVNFDKYAEFVDAVKTFFHFLIVLSRWMRKVLILNVF